MKPNKYKSDSDDEFLPVTGKALGKILLEFVTYCLNPELMRQLRNEQKYQKMTNIALAQKTGLNAKLLSSILGLQNRKKREENKKKKPDVNSKNKNPTLATLLKIASALDMKIVAIPMRDINAMSEMESKHNKFINDLKALIDAFEKNNTENDS